MKPSLPGWESRASWTRGVSRCGGCRGREDGCRGEDGKLDDVETGPGIHAGLDERVERSCISPEVDGEEGEEDKDQGGSEGAGGVCWRARERRGRPKSMMRDELVSSGRSLIREQSLAKLQREGEKRTKAPSSASSTVLTSSPSARPSFESRPARGCL